MPRLFDPGLLDDAAAVLSALGEPPENIVLFGRSIGSLFAIELAALYPNVAGLVLESGIADPLERVLFRVSHEELGVNQRFGFKLAEWVDKLTVLRLLLR